MSVFTSIILKVYANELRISTKFICGAKFQLEKTSCLSSCFYRPNHASFGYRWVIPLMIVVRVDCKDLCVDRLCLCLCWLCISLVMYIFMYIVEICDFSISEICDFFLTVWMYFRWPGFLSLRIPNGVTEFLPDGPTVTWWGEGSMCMEEIPFGVYIHVFFHPSIQRSPKGLGLIRQKCHHSIFF